MVTVVGRDDKYRYQATCKTCASILEYWEQEVQRAIHTDYGGGSESWEYIVCPNCCGGGEDYIPAKAKVEVTNRKRK